MKSQSEQSLLTRFRILRFFGRMLMPEYRFKWPQMQWWKEEWFTDFLKAFEEEDRPNTDRKWMLVQLLRMLESVPGDTAECGVYLGASSYLMALMNKETKAFQRTHHLFDSFEGLSEPSDKDGVHWSKGDLSIGEEVVRKKLSKFSELKFHKGWIPEKFNEVKDLKFAFVHIDVDLYQPTLDSIAFFYERMSAGGIILCDDYGFTSCPGATKACDEFLEGKPEQMIALSCGGGFIIKGVETSNSGRLLSTQL